MFQLLMRGGYLTKTSMKDLNEYINIHNGIIVHIFYNLLDLLLSEDTCYQDKKCSIV